MNQSATLYQIEEDLQAFIDTEALVPADQLESFALELAQANELALDKRDRVIRFIRHVESQIDFAKAEKARINDWQKSLEGGLERFRDYLAHVVATYGAQPKGAAKLVGKVGTLTLRKTPDTALITDEAEIPAEYKTVTVTMPAAVWASIAAQFPAAANHPASETIAKKPILDALKAGVDVPGAELVFGHDVLQVK